MPIPNENALLLGAWLVYNLEVMPLENHPLWGAVTLIISRIRCKSIIKAFTINEKFPKCYFF